MKHISQISKGFGRETAAFQVATGSPLVEELLHVQIRDQIEIFLSEDRLDMSTDIALVTGVGGQLRPCLKNKSCTKGQDMSN